MTMPAKVIDRLFQRLLATYGAAWTRMYADAPVNDVKSAWAHELSGFSRHLEAIAWALENLPERCPNVIEFKALCRKAPAPELPRLPEPKPDPQRLAAELSKLGQLRASVADADRPAAKDWARRIIAIHQSGCRVNPTTLRFAAEAIGHGV